nr:sm-like protein LSM7 [Tanacetum cinerariifolium]
GAFSIAPGASGVALGNYVTPTAVLVVSTNSPNVPAGPSNKGKSLMVEEDIPVPARTFRQWEEDRLGEKATRRLHEEEMAEIETERAEAHRKRQQE